MKKSYSLRTFLLFCVLLAICFGGTGFLYTTSRETSKNNRDWITYTQGTLVRADNLEQHIERLLASERGYLLDGQRDSGSLALYTLDKNEIRSLLAELHDRIADDPNLEEQLGLITTATNNFSQQLDLRIASDKTSPEEVARSSATRDQLLKLINEFIKGQDDVLHSQLVRLGLQRRIYFAAIITGGVGSALLLLLFNASVLSARAGRQRAEKNLSAMQESFRLAVEGARDGVFDWNLRTGNAYYSPHFWTMLGYSPDEFPPTFGAFRALLNPNDLAGVEERRLRYLSGETQDYSDIFRLKNHSGGWTWISARGTALFDQKGTATRMVGFHTDITALKMYEEQLEGAREQAERASRAKTDFLAHMSHEIRTPLTAISGIAEIFDRNKENLNEKQKLLVRTLNSSASLLAELVNDILDFSKIESGELSLERAPFPLADLFEQVTNIAAIKAQEKKLDFAVDADGVRHLFIVGDKARLRQILINLIANAIKFTDEGSVRVRASRVADGNTESLRIDVIDTGIGIDPAHFDLIFERFKQADSSVSRRYGGTGLGLPISRRLAGLMGGEILLDSAPGRGSTFSLIIPLTLAASAAQTSPVQAPQSSSDRSHRILLAEDYEGNIVMFSYLLDTLGVAYDVARTGREALTLWEAHDYDIILMDIQMPELDGFAATEEIRKREKDEGRTYTPVFGITAHALIGDREKCIAAGMDAYLAKPISEADLKARIMQVIGPGSQAAA